MPEVNIVVRDKGEHINSMPGSKSTAGKSTIYIRTWENRKSKQIVFISYGLFKNAMLE